MISNSHNGIDKNLQHRPQSVAVAPANLKDQSQELKSTPKSRFSWTLANFCLDAAMLVVFLGLVFVSTVTRFIFPAATAASGWELWGYSVDDWLSAQFGLLGLLTFGIVVHLMLHWSWVCGVFFKRFRKSKLPDDGIRTIYGVGLMILILNVMGLLIGAAALTIKSPL